jgi:hypothetical protein
MPPKASFSRASFFSTTRSVTEANSLISAPAQNVPPVPVRTTARTSSRSRSSVTSIRRSLRASVTRLSGGLFRTTLITPSPRSSVMMMSATIS